MGPRHLEAAVRALYGAGAADFTVTEMRHLPVGYQVKLEAVAIDTGTARRAAAAAQAGGFGHGDVSLIPLLDVICIDTGAREGSPDPPATPRVTEAVPHPVAINPRP